MMKLKSFWEKGNNYRQLFKHFQNPLLVVSARLGWVNMAYCSYRIRKNGTEYTMLGRARGGDLWILREVLAEETYRPILKLLPPRPLRVVDIGAHIGAFTIWLHRQHDVAEAFCFEPDPDSFSLCQFNLQHNGCNNVRLDGSALGGGTRESEIWVNPIAHARSSLYQSRVTNPSLYGRKATNVTFQHPKVDVVALDKWLQTVQGEFDLLKMDCEGSEWEILDAAPTAFTRFSNIVAEIHDDPMGTYKREDFAVVLREYGFTTVDFSRLYIGRRS